jgi:hypothetical protein
MQMTGFDLIRLSIKESAFEIYENAAIDRFVCASRGFVCRRDPLLCRGDKNCSNKFNAQ